MKTEPKGPKGPRCCDGSYFPQIQIIIVIATIKKPYILRYKDRITWDPLGNEGFCPSTAASAVIQRGGCRAHRREETGPGKDVSELRFRVSGSRVYRKAQNSPKA